MVTKAKKNQKKKLKQLGKKAEKLLTRFRKKFPELIQNTTANDWADLLLMGGLAYAGWATFKDWKGALLGPISFKLATTDGIVSQGAGLAGLIALGVAMVGPNAPPGPEWFKGADQPIPGRELIGATIDPMTNLASCPEGYRKVTPWPGVIMCQKE